MASLRPVLQIGLFFLLGVSLGTVFHLNSVLSGTRLYIWGGQQKCSTGRKEPLPTGRPLTWHRKPSPALYSETHLFKERKGTVFDCVTWDELYRYDADTVANMYRVFPVITKAGEADESRQNSFVEIFKKQVWGGREVNVHESNINYKASGPGSALENSQGIIAILHVWIDKLKLESNKTSIKILDLPCGDLQYMSHFLKTRTDIDYTGIDIVPELINKHKKKYERNPRIHFKNMDIVKEKIQGSYDLIICRMMLQHLLNKDILKALYHFSYSNSTYFGATTFSADKMNQELQRSGYRFRHVNLEIAPVSLSPPVCTYKPPIHGHYFAIWRLPLLRRI